MKQILQHFKTGELRVEDVPPPALKHGGVLVENFYSLVSAGTERAAVELGEKGLIGKAKERPDLVKVVINKVKNEGLINTFQRTMGALDSWRALGYSSAGVVVEVDAGVDGIASGDRVACGGGGYACHAEVIFVPKNLVAKIPDNVDFESAAFTTLGAIAMQGVRIAGLTLGEKVVVIGLGLVGQLTVQLVKAAGCSVFGIDLDRKKINIALELGADTGAVRSEDVHQLVSAFSNGAGADAVIITAATSNNDPVVLAGEISRDRGRVVVVGETKIDAPRSLYYGKELELRLSRSYGPGRYDKTYEEKGIDYPIGYVRWTEKRNMEAFFELLAQGKVNVQKLITHRIPIKEALRAYELITGKTEEKYLGILIQYGDDVVLSRKVPIQPTSVKKHEAKEQVNVGFIGAGNFAKAVLLPNLKKNPSVRFKTIAAATGTSSKRTGEKYGFEACTTDYHEILEDEQIDTVFIATRHNLHAPLVIESLKKGKNVFVEKPLALNEEELKEIIASVNSLENTASSRLMVGFNRRFSPFTLRAKKFFASRSEPLAVNYRINAGFVSPDNWVLDPKEGGGRIIGEVCHFVDFINYIVGKNPVRVSAEALTGAETNSSSTDTVSILIKYEDGSVGTINYWANGDRAYPKERIEIFGNQSIFVIDNFRKAEWARNGKRGKKKMRFSQGKGHREELEAFVQTILHGEPSPIDFNEAVISTLTTFKVNESLNAGAPVVVSGEW